MTPEQLKAQGFVKISPKAAKARVLAGKPCVVFLVIEHDDRCKTLRTDRGDDCNCQPSESFYLLKGAAA